uniref:Receptor expression-enhancing protein n=2 Tax=Hemiselmis andersenii TaxID=464988 RepID=A0A7S0Y2F1_HEMAN
MNTPGAGPGEAEAPGGDLTPVRRLQYASAEAARCAVRAGERFRTKLEYAWRSSAGSPNRIPVAIGAALLSVFIARKAGRKAVQGVSTLVATAYPCYLSFKSMSESDDTLRRRIVMYWVVYAMLRNIEAWFDGILSFIPNYSLAKLAFIVWLQRGGAPIVYALGVHPVLAANEGRIDTAIATASSQAEMAGKEWGALREGISQKLRRMVQEQDWARGTV